MKQLIMKLKKENKNQTGYLRRFFAYVIDWYLGSALSSVPLILLYMSLHPEATIIPQSLSIFTEPYNIIAGLLSLLVSVFYYVLVPAYIWKGQTPGKKMLGLKIIDHSYEDASVKQIWIRQLVMILLVEGSIYTASNILHQLLGIITGWNIAKPLAFIGIVISLCSAIIVFVFPAKKSFHDMVAHTIVMNIRLPQYDIQKRKNKKKKRK